MIQTPQAADIIVRLRRQASVRGSDGALELDAAQQITSLLDQVAKWRDEASSLLFRCMKAELAASLAALPGPKA